jgi:hypothetical protein
MTPLNKVSFGLFSLITIAIIFLMFPVVLCPMMWAFFALGICAQFIVMKEFTSIGRGLTVVLFLLVAFRIYFGFTTDFSISAPDSLALKFLIFAGLYGAGTILMLNWRNIQKYTQYLSLAVALCSGYSGYAIVNEVYYEAYVRFQTTHPDSIALNNFESKDNLREIEKMYKKLAKPEDKGMVYHAGTHTVNGYFYTVVLSDGSGKNMPPLFTVEKKDSDTVQISKLTFRYEPDLRYGFIRYEIFAPKGKIVLDKDTAKAALKEYFEHTEEIMKR